MLGLFRGFEFACGSNERLSADTQFRGLEKPKIM